MKYTNLGKSGLKVSRICLGTMTYGSPSWRKWILPEEESRPFLKRALELGINFFDTADMYSLGRSEEILGRAIKDFGRRDQVILATKVFFPMSEDPDDRGLSRKHILASIDASLKRLGTDYVDLYQIHRYDYDTPLEETLETLHEVVKSGKARCIGASSMHAWQFARALYLADRHGWTRFVSMQNHYNLVYREEEREMIPLCRAEEIGVIPWSPLARGFLAGNRRKKGWGDTLRAQTDDYAQTLYFEDSDFEVADRVMTLASRRNVPPTQVALAWLLGRPGIAAPIIGATKMEHLEQAVAAVDIALNPDECAFLEEPYKPHKVLGHH